MTRHRHDEEIDPSEDPSGPDRKQPTPRWYERRSPNTKDAGLNGARRALESAAALEKQTAILRALHAAHPALARFDGVEALIAFARDASIAREEKDPVLLALLVAHKQTRDGGALLLLAHVMFPMLLTLYRELRRRTAGDEREEVWSRIYEAFAEVVDWYPVERRPVRIPGNLHGELRKRLHHALQRKIRDDRAVAECSRDAEVIAPFHPAPDVPAVNAGPLGWTPSPKSAGDDGALDEAEIARAQFELDGLVLRRVITTDDRTLLLRRLRGLSWEAAVEDLELSPVAARKRMSRALRAIAEDRVRATRRRRTATKRVVVTTKEKEKAAARRRSA